jgi:hypothetical protein
VDSPARAIVRRVGETAARLKQIRQLRDVGGVVSSSAMSLRCCAIWFSHGDLLLGFGQTLLNDRPIHCRRF